MVCTGLHQKIFSPPDFRKTSIHQSISKTRTRLYREEAYTTIIGLFGADGVRICKNKSNTNVRLIRIICLHHKRNIKKVKRLSNWAVLTQFSWANSSFGRSKLQPTYSDLTKSLGERSPTKSGNPIAQRVSLAKLPRPISRDPEIPQQTFI